MSPKQSLYLVGMPGAGKSSIGRRLAALTELEFIDADQEIVERTGVPISTIFELEGEAGFRSRESALIASLTQRPRILLATGGGAVLDPSNRHLLSTNGFVVYLCASLDHLWQRTRSDMRRPLLQGPSARQKLEELFEARDPLYRECADLVVETGKLSVQKVARRVFEDLRNAGFRSQAIKRITHGREL